MITLDDLKNELKCYMTQCPPSDFMLQCIVDMVNAKEPCMLESGYSECEIKLAQMTAAIILAIYQFPTYFQSRSVDDASVTSDESRNDRISQLESALYKLDPAGCLTPLLPTKPGTVFFAVVEGSSCKGCK